MARALAELYIAQRSKDGAPHKKIVLDFDATDEPTHGDQEQSYYHAYFEEHISITLFCSSIADTGQLIRVHSYKRATPMPEPLHGGPLEASGVGLLRSAWGPA
jgi:hypothetical protein